MAKRRKYGDAWKDVQIDAEQNDAVFDRFFKRTSQPSVTEPDTDSGEPPESVEPSQITARSSAPTPVAPTQPVEKRSQAKATVTQLDPTAGSNASDGSAIANQVLALKQQYRLSKGEAAILKQLLQRAQDAGSSECYAKIPELADTCTMTHRGCQFALKSLQDRDFIVRLRDYDPADRLGILFLIKLPSA